MGSGKWNIEHSAKERKQHSRLYPLLDRLFTRETIDGGGRCEYLNRWWLRRARNWGVYLHHFVMSDWSRDLHNHPRRFVSIGLWGSYYEETPDGKMVRYRAPWIRTFPAHHIHRVILPEGKTCWTIVIVLKVTQEWGFFPLGKFVPWREYVKSSRADEAKIC